MATCRKAFTHWASKFMGIHYRQTIDELDVDGEYAKEVSLEGKRLMTDSEQRLKLLRFWVEFETTPMRVRPSAQRDTFDKQPRPPPR